MDRGVKLNNKGFTLIETIVAMTILVLVSVPVMDSISRGMKINRDTSSFQRAVLLGQSVTEGIKSHSVPDLCKTFVRQDKYVFDVLDKNVYNFAGYGRLSTANGVDYSEMAINTDTSYDANARQYYYGIYGVESGAKKYDVLVKLDSEEYNDINSKIIPSIVNVGSDSTAVIDNTGILCNTTDRDLKDLAIQNGVSTTNMRCIMNIYIKKYNSSSNIIKGAYHVYGNVTYTDGSHSYTIENVGESSFDSKYKLKYLYIVCNGSRLSESFLYKSEIKIHFSIGDLLEEELTKVDIPVAIVTSPTSKVKWNLSVDGANARDYLQFFTNNGTTNNGVGNIYTTESATTLNNFGDSGKKIRRIYGLSVQVYDYQPEVSHKFKTAPISDIKSAFIR